MNIPSPVSRKRARIEIIPLIDIIFFLLATFVMVSLSMVNNKGIHVNLPSAKVSVPAKEGVIVTISITEQGVLFLNKQAMSMREILSRLISLRKNDPDLGVVINGDEKAFFGEAVALLDEIRGIGITKLMIQTKGKTGKNE